MQPWEKRAITTSFVITSTLGATFIFWYWSTAGITSVAGARATLFVTLMAILHAGVAKLYATRPMPAKARSSDFRRQKANQSREDESIGTISPLYENAIRFALIQIVSILIVSALVLDGGDLNRMVIGATFSHLFLIAVCVGLRPNSPTKLDLALIRTGFVPLTMLICGIVFWIRPIWNR